MRPLQVPWGLGRPCGPGNLVPGSHAFYSRVVMFLVNIMIIVMVMFICYDPSHHLIHIIIIVIVLIIAIQSALQVALLSGN